MAVVKKIAGLAALAALTFYAPGLGIALAGSAGFLASAIGAAIVVAGTFAIQSLLLGGGRNSASMEAGKINVRISDPPRWLNAGRARSGGGALFGEFDAKGRFWYIIVNSDEIVHAPFTHFLDDEPVTIGSDHYVTQFAFRLKTNKDKDPATVDGEGKGYVRIWTTTYSEMNPVPPGIAELTEALPQWTATEHLLVGTTYSVVCMDALDVEHRYKIYRWRGPFGLGEPAVSVLGEWANAYDPRDPAQTLGNRSTYKATRNASLIWAWFRTHPFGRGKPESSINWQKVGEQADISDEIVTGIEGDQPRYEAGVSIPDSKRRVDAEADILKACDGLIFFDENGKSWMRVGHWYAPTLSFSRNRDVMAVSSMEARDGESETQGVIVKYMEPAANYSVQPSAAWLNPLYYDPLTTPKFLTVEIEACQNHNQAMRLAKGIGMRSQPRHKIVPIVNLRGLQARHERIVEIRYDNVFDGVYEIPAPVELSDAGISTSFGAVPISPSRWTLLAGEEQPKPVVDGTDGTISYPAIVGENVYLSDGGIRIDFPALARDDATYVAEYILTSAITGDDSDPWTSMSVNQTTAASAVLPQGESYTARYRYVTTAGRGPAFEYAALSTNAVLPAATNLTVTGGVGQAIVTWKNPNDLRFFSSDVYRGTTTVFSAATKIVDSYGGGVGQVQSITDTVAAGTYRYWVVATDGAALDATPTGPVSGTVT
jgi:hypothetical protein